MALPIHASCHTWSTDGHDNAVLDDCDQREDLAFHFAFHWTAYMQVPTSMVAHAVLGSNINNDFDAAKPKQLHLHAATKGQHHMYLAVDRI